MNRTTLAVTCALVATTAFCAAKPAPTSTIKNMTPEQKQRLREARMRQTGGFVVIPGAGHLAVFNAQKQFVKADITNAISRISSFTHGGVSVKFADAPFSITTAKAEREKHGAGACVFLIDDETFPMSLVALEENWGFVNVAPLREGNPNEAKLAARFHKEFVRISSVVFGGVKSQYKTSPLQSVSSVRELDKTIGDDYGMDTMIAMSSHLPEIGVVSDQRITYREACRRGIASQPTNDVQRAIWDEVHAIPQKPMKIEFDPKKGR